MLRSLLLAGLALAPTAVLAQVVPAGGSPNQDVIVSAFNTSPLASPELLTARQSLSTLGGSERNAALSSFAPSGYSLLPELTLRAAEFQEQSVRRYLRDYRAGGTGVEGPAGDTPTNSRVIGLWATGQGTDGRYNADADRGRTNFGTWSGMGGIDIRFANKSLLGVMGGYSNLDANLSEGSPRSRIKNWFAGGYGTLGVGPLYLDLFGSYGEADYDLRRNLAFGADTGTGLANSYGFTADGNSRTWLAGGTLGLSFNFAGFEMEPFAGVRYANLRLDGINEGSGFAALTTDRKTFESLQSNVGLRIGAAIDLGGGTTLRPEVRGGWRREWFDDLGQGIRYGLSGFGTTGNTLAYDVRQIPRDFATAGAGFTVSGPGSPVSLVVDYNGEYGRGRQIHGVSGGLRMTF